MLYIHAGFFSVYMLIFAAVSQMHADADSMFVKYGVVQRRKFEK